MKREEREKRKTSAAPEVQSNKDIETEGRKGALGRRGLPRITVLKGTGRGHKIRKDVFSWGVNSGSYPEKLSGKDLYRDVRRRSRSGGGTWRPSASLVGGRPYPPRQDGGREKWIEQSGGQGVCSAQVGVS